MLLAGHGERAALLAVVLHTLLRNRRPAVVVAEGTREGPADSHPSAAGEDNLVRRC